MFKLTGDGSYVDLLEQSLYNAVLAGVSLEGNTFCYATPLACDTEFKRQPWFEVPCCPTTASRFLPSIGRYVYSQSADGLWVNLYVGGEVSVTRQNGATVKVLQKTDYPWDGHVRLQVEVDRPQKFTLHVRIPGWAQASTLRLNGAKLSPPVSKGYAHIHARWSFGKQSQYVVYNKHLNKKMPKNKANFPSE